MLHLRRFELGSEYAFVFATVKSKHLLIFFSWPQRQKLEINAYLLAIGLCCSFYKINPLSVYLSLSLFLKP